jgi:hypothetical protein
MRLSKSQKLRLTLVLLGEALARFGMYDCAGYNILYDCEVRKAKLIIGLDNDEVVERLEHFEFGIISVSAHVAGPAQSKNRSDKRLRMKRAEREGYWYSPSIKGSPVQTLWGCIFSTSSSTKTGWNFSLSGNSPKELNLKKH